MLFFSKNRIIRPPTVAQLYYKELEALSIDLKDLDNFLNSDDLTLEEDLAQYLPGLNNLKNPCRQMNIYFNRYRNDNLTIQTKDNMSNSKQLCDDFLSVLDHSQTLFINTQNYLATPVNNWPEPTDDNFLSHMTYVSDVTAASIKSLEQSPNHVSDPALDELKQQLQLAQNKLNQAVEAKKAGDVESSARYTQELIELISQDKHDFIAARNYYWRNTVNIAALSSTVNRLKDSFTE